MKKLFRLIIGIVVFLVVAAAAVYYTPTGQDLVLKRVLKIGLSQTVETYDGLRVVVCGSASPLGNDPDRAQACIAVITPDHFFLFDVGARSPLRIAQAQLPVGRLNGVFLTHFHSDHISGLPDVNLTSWVTGRPEPLNVYGPEGVQSIVDGFNMAYGLDRTYRTAHHGLDMLPPSTGPMQANTFSMGDVVWKDDELTVTSFAVSHPPVEPAVGYRVDYRGRSVVISGDTNSSENLFTAAKGADLLLHDALSRTMLDPMIQVATDLEVPILPTIMTDVIDYHADKMGLAEEAEKAGIKLLAFYHMVPVPSNPLAERIFMRDMPDDVILTRDLQMFDLPPDADEIVVHDP